MRFIAELLGAALLLATAPDLASALTVPQVFKNTNLLRTVDIKKGYVRESVGVIIENISDQPQSDYYIPFTAEDAKTISYVTAKDKKEGTACTSSLVQEDSVDSTRYYKITLPAPLQPQAQITLQIAIGITDTLVPVPAEIPQADKQYLKYTGSQYASSAYVTVKQKTKLKFPNNELSDVTTFEPKADGTADPERSGAVVTYGPYENQQPSLKKDVSARFEYTLPVIRMDKLERDIEISHWGGNIAIEERYWMTNVGAKLKGHFSRVAWATTAYYNPPTSAVKQLNYPLLRGSKDAYFTDEIGNVSTSRFRSNLREAHLELKPRYPVFGGWNYSFVVGWNNELDTFLRKTSSGDEYVLKVPFLEGPKESVTYTSVEVTIILPEGASDIQYIAPMPIEKEERYLHKTFLDTVGRSAVKLTLKNVVDEQRGQDIIVTYHYTAAAAMRKPMVVGGAALTIYLVALILGRLDVSIGK